MQISSLEFEEETGDKLVDPTNQEAKNSTRRKAWKTKVENINMQIINDNNFLQLDKYYDFYNNMDRIKL